jgi:diketogulonate reductase-like aldo/keto reductase
VVSKLASPFHRSEHVKQALRKTLNDLRLEYLDLYLVHWPVAFRHVPIIDPSKRGWDNEDIDDSDGGKNIDTTVSIHETWQAMEDCVDAGLVRHIGVSNFPVSLLHELLTRARIAPLINQCEAHPYLQQSRLVEYCQARGIEFQAYSPLGTPGYKETQEPTVLDDPQLQAIAGAHGVTTSQVCLAWALQRNTSVVVKSTSSQHQADNLKALNLQLSRDDITTIAGLDRNYRFFRPEDWWGSIGAVFD